MLYYQIAFIFFLLITNRAYAEEIPAFIHQVIPLQQDSDMWPIHQHVWADVNMDGRKDLLAVSSSRRLAIYHQGISSFPTIPTQIVQLPRETIWFTIANIDQNQKNVELLVSTTEKILSSSQSNGKFEAKFEVLIQTKQVFSEARIPYASWLEHSEIYGFDQTAFRIPIITSNQAIMYVVNENDQVHQVEKYKLKKVCSEWQEHATKWNIRNKECKEIRMRIEAKYNTPSTAFKKELEGDELESKFKHRIDPNIAVWRWGVTVCDINGDDKKDAVYWSMSGKFDIEKRLTIMIYIRNDNGELPNSADQVLRCLGVPIDFSFMTKDYSLPLIDVNGDSFLDIVLIHPKKKIVNVSTLMEMALTNKVEWVFTVRLFRPGYGYSQQPDVRKNIMAAVVFGHGKGIVRLNGDFNNDGRPDLMVKGISNQIEVYMSSSKGELYKEDIGLTFKALADDWPILTDLNTDRIPDIYFINDKTGNLELYISRSASSERG